MNNYPYHKLVRDMPKLYESWPGSNRFWFGGVSGPAKDMGGNIYIYLCILGAVIPFSIVMFDIVWKENPVLPILFFVMTALAIVFLNLTTYTDPGIIPRRPYIQLNHQNIQSKKDYKKYLTKSQTVDRKICWTCKIYKPSRASHCRICDNCVQVMDHHCGFVGTCIGKRNYRFFFFFLIFLCLTLVFFLVNVIVYANADQTDATNGFVAIIICSIILGLIGLQLIGFFIFHIYLIITGNTTRQVIKGKQDEDEEVNQWCIIDPTIVDYRKQITEKEESQLIQALSNLKTLVLQE